jgi:hypothetical protein
LFFGLAQDFFYVLFSMMLRGDFFPQIIKFPVGGGVSWVGFVVFKD